LAWSRLRSGARNSGEPVLAELVPQASLADAEQPRRPRLHLLGVLEGFQDHVALETIEGVVQAQARWLVLGRRARNLQVEQPHANRVGAAEDHRPLDDVFELPPVAGPGILLQRPERRLGDLRTAP